MHDVSPQAEADRNGAGYFIGLMVAFSGYGIALIGCLAFFKIPVALTVAMMSGGLLTATLLPRLLDRRLAFVVRSRRGFVAAYIVGSLLIVAVMVLFANSNFSTWTFHPAGFQSTWWVLVTGFFHVDGIFLHSERKGPSNDIPVSEYDEPQRENPYAPPMDSEQRTNNPLQLSGGSSAQTFRDFTNRR